MVHEDVTVCGLGRHLRELVFSVEGGGGGAAFLYTLGRNWIFENRAHENHTRAASQEQGAHQSTW